MKLLIYSIVSKGYLLAFYIFVILSYLLFDLHKCKENKCSTMYYPTARNRDILASTGGKDRLNLLPLLLEAIAKLSEIFSTDAETNLEINVVWVTQILFRIDHCHSR